MLECVHSRHGHPWPKAKEKDATSWPLDMLHIQLKGRIESTNKCCGYKY